MGNLFGKFLKEAYTALNKTQGSYETVSLQEVKDLLDNKKAVLIDVRNPDELQKTGHIKGSINIPLGDLEKRLSELDKKQPYITFCAVGGRSMKAAAILANNGFETVYNAEEGMSTWPYSDMVEK